MMSVRVAIAGLAVLAFVAWFVVTRTPTEQPPAPSTLADKRPEPSPAPESSARVAPPARIVAAGGIGEQDPHEVVPLGELPPETRDPMNQVVSYICDTLSEAGYDVAVNSATVGISPRNAESFLAEADAVDKEHNAASAAYARALADDPEPGIELPKEVDILKFRDQVRAGQHPTIKVSKFDNIRIYLAGDKQYYRIIREGTYPELDYLHTTLIGKSMLREEAFVRLLGRLTLLPAATKGETR